MKLKKGDKVRITGNSIFEMMGFPQVNGEVFLIYPDGHGFSFRCRETGSMETCDFGDGDIQKN
jgi:hypothetical protein